MAKAKANKVKVERFTASDFLDSEIAVEESLKAAMEDPNPDVFLRALSEAAKVRGIASMAERSGLGRESLYKTLAPCSKPRYETICKLVDALGLKMTIVRPSQGVQERNGIMANQGCTPQSFLKDAKSLYQIATTSESLSHDPVQICFFWGRSIELGLKAFLMSKGVSPSVLKRKFGHNLTKLLREAQARGLSSLVGNTAMDVASVPLLSLDYASKRYEYRESGGTYFIPDEALVSRFIRRLLRGIEFHLTAQT